MWNSPEYGEFSSPQSKTKKKEIGGITGWLKRTSDLYTPRFRVPECRFHIAIDLETLGNDISAASLERILKNTNCLAECARAILTVARTKDRCPLAIQDIPLSAAWNSMKSSCNSQSPHMEQPNTTASYLASSSVLASVTFFNVTSAPACLRPAALMGGIFCVSGGRTVYQNWALSKNPVISVMVS
ncbi:MAG: hypothetical protein C5S47_00825 [Candidatus Methanogasteraceae archaeon]|nr:MAG: hypothetical protein C5S47_00825 [ANME-2 cluster archaeon]